MIDVEYLKRVDRLINQVKFRDWQFWIGIGSNYLYLQIRAPGICARTGEPIKWHGRKWLLSPYMTDSEIVSTAMMAVLAAVEHEAREDFRFRGVAIYGPHIAVDRLVPLCADPGHIDGRMPMPPANEAGAP